MSHPYDGRPARGEWHTIQPTPRGEPNLTLLTELKGRGGMSFDRVVTVLQSEAGQRGIPVLMRFGRHGSRRGVAIEVDDSGILRIVKLGKLVPSARRHSEHDVIALVHRAADGQLYAEFAD